LVSEPGTRSAPVPGTNDMADDESVLWLTV
jgi:hypothetical protein